MNKWKRLLPLAVLLMPGCGPSLQEPADEARAREALQTVLEAWQRGDRPDSLGTASPAVLARDPDWSSGHRLTRYEIRGDGARAGLDMRYPVVLSLRDPNGRAVQRNTTFVVGTRPKLTVVRQDRDS